MTPLAQPGDRQLQSTDTPLQDTHPMDSPTSSQHYLSLPNLCRGSDTQENIYPHPEQLRLSTGGRP